ncbi:histidine phosphatase family protein [Mycobacterium sp. CBMA271]|uniref:histidine phosphatase family protein n=1 Tax=unclassified Mycobacteroides TaxID=2618759 RepID=UPI0012DFD11D|nr:MULTISPECIES: histidine phosphatase family protein [unclassified Mycobacteroides]MUM15473.1 phosphoglycerate mutase [Mycobacteroides sp. CBMA 326]MUM23562.1 histidine phosphatase family protein [Mycobacteroides sp. CBMA 271]
MGVIYLVRHGQAANYSSSPDSPLTSIGQRQADTVAAELARRGLGGTRVVHGGMKRQRQTGEAVALALGSEPQQDDRWDEYDYKEIVGNSRMRRLASVDTVKKLAKGDTQAILEDGLAQWASTDSSGEYAESYTRFQQRVLAAMADITTLDGDTVVATSAGVIGMIVADRWSGSVANWLTAQRVVINSSVTSLVNGRRGLSLLSFNDHTHLLGGGGNRDLVTYR